jgi:N-formylmaleamate deformylase
MLKYTEGDAKVKGIKIHYYRTGGGKPPFVLLHGASDNGLCWGPVAELLADKYDVIMPDAQGHGLSDRVDASFSSHSHTEQIAGLIRQLGLKKPIIMGHSMGAGTTVNIAVEYPEIPRAIILEDPAWMTPPSTPTDLEADKKRHEEIRQQLTGYAKISLEENMARCRVENPSWSEAEIQPWAKSKLQFDPAIMSRMVVNVPPYTELVPKINCPTLLVISDGGLVTPEAAKKAASLWKSRQPFKWVQIKGAGHNIRREQLPAFRDALFGFLDSLNSQ